MKAKTFYIDDAQEEVLEKFKTAIHIRSTNQALSLIFNEGIASFRRKAHEHKDGILINFGDVFWDQECTEKFGS